jgi:SAM-dependent methyltransferase
MRLLNLGCGNRFHSFWTNVDFVSNNKNVIAHNLLSGIPFADNSFDIVYHSHVLEHFSKADGELFIKECYRVLHPSGIIRVVVPDLEQIAIEYCKNLEMALQGDFNAGENYDWIMLELFDQTVRNESGGDMAKYIYRNNILNEDYLYSRIGDEGRIMRNLYLHNKIDTDLSKIEKAFKYESNKQETRDFGFRKFLDWVKKILFQSEIDYYNKLKREAAIGKFRLGGEIHQWMYDRYSLSKSLKKSGFFNVEVKTAFSSNISNWGTYELESKNGIIYKPDSLFIEAMK